MPTIQILGAGELVLYPAPGRCRDPMTPAKVEMMRPLLEAQDYITGVRFADGPQEGPECVCLDDWRQTKRHRDFLADTVADWFGVRLDACKAWLTVEPRPVAKFVINRTERYLPRRPTFPWGTVVKKLGAEAVFVGTTEEHATFCDKFGQVPYYPTPTLLDLAQVIAGSCLFLGNMSCARGIAEGLKHAVWVEQGWPKNTFIRRPGARYDGVMLPKELAHGRNHKIR